MRGTILIGAVVATLLMPAAASAQTVIEGTAGDDSIHISGLTPVAGTYSVNLGADTPLAGATSVTVNAGAGNDRVYISNPPGSLFAPPLGIRVNGGDGSDEVVDAGGAAAQGSLDHVAADGPGTKTITHTGALPQKIVADSVELVEDSVEEQTWTYRGSDGADDISLVDGGLIPTRTGAVCCFPSRVRDASGEAEPTWKSAVVIDTKASGATPDVVTLTGTQPIADNVTVDDGLATPEDTVHLSYSPGIWAGDLGMKPVLNVRGKRVDGNGFRGESLALEATELAPDGGGPLSARVKNLEIETPSSVNVTSDQALQLGGASQRLHGVRSSAGSVSVETPGRITVTAGDEAKGRAVTFTSGSVDLLGRVAAPGGTVGLRPRAAGSPIQLGAVTETAGAYSVSEPELRHVAAARAEVGSPASGLLSVTAPVTSNAALSLVSGGGFTGTGAGAIQAPSIGFVDGSGTGRTWTVDSAGVTVSPGAAIPFAATTSVSLQGGTGADHFRVKASRLVPFSLNGGDPTTVPGDTLTYVAEGRAVSGDRTPPDGRIDSPGVKPVAFGAIEGVSIAP